VDVVRRFSQLAGVRLLGLPDLMAASGGAEATPDFVSEQRADWAAHTGAWAALYGRMADSDSRQTLLDVLRFRLTADPAYMAAYVFLGALLFKRREI